MRHAQCERQDLTPMGIIALRLAVATGQRPRPGIGSANYEGMPIVNAVEAAPHIDRCRSVRNRVKYLSGEHGVSDQAAQVIKEALQVA